MTDIASKRKLLKIKCGAVARLFKETTLYRVEAEELEEKRSKLLAAGVDAGEWDVKNATKMKDESERMVEDTTKRLKTAVDALEILVVNASTEMGQDEEFLKAEQLLLKIKGTTSDEEGENVESVVDTMIDSGSPDPTRGA